MKERPPGSRGSLLLIGPATLAHPASFGTRKRYVDYGSTKSWVQRRFSLARKDITALRFRFAWTVFAGNPSRASCRLPLAPAGTGAFSYGAENRERESRKPPGKAENARGDSISHERHNRIVHCLVTECPIPDASNTCVAALQPEFLHRIHRSAAWPAFTPAILPG